MTKYDVFCIPKRQISYTGRKRTSGCPGVENRDEGAFWGDENILILDCGDVC